MKHTITYLLLLFVATIAFAQDNPQLYQNGGVYYRDKLQSIPYTGYHREYYDNGTLRLEMQIADGVPEGTFVVYFEENRKPQEIRSYRNGKLNGLWRTYDIAGQLIQEAEYNDGEKNGTWRIWDESGTLRYEMNYYNGIKTGLWRMWDEAGNLVSEKNY